MITSQTNATEYKVQSKDSGTCGFKGKLFAVEHDEVDGGRDLGGEDCDFSFHLGVAVRCLSSVEIPAELPTRQDGCKIVFGYYNQYNSIS
jgi:hypothetical protein